MPSFDVEFPSSRDSFTKLDESNFLEWKENMMGLLMAKKLWKYVQTEHGADEEGDQQAKGFIWMSIEHQQRSYVPASANAYTTWRALCAKHEQVGPQVIANCIFGITAVRYVDGTKMEDHLAKMKEYFTRLDAVNCQLPETVKAVFLLASLSPSWTVFKQTQTAAASTASPLTVSTVSLAILQERDRRLNEEPATSFLDNSPSALAAYQQASTPRPRMGDATCSWCLKRRHEEKDCWAKRDGKPRTIRGAVANASEPPVASSNYMVFTALSTTPDAGAWYMDSGASDHCCHEVNLVKSVTPCAIPDVVSANGSRVPVVGSGSVDITVRPVRTGQPDRTITLSDVCLVPGLGTNLVSVSRLIADGLNVHFSRLLCIVRRGKHIIATADLVESDNLYRLRTVSKLPIQAPYGATADTASHVSLPPRPAPPYEHGACRPGLSESSSRGGVDEAS
jgi:hypothetical protein